MDWRILVFYPEPEASDKIYHKTKVFSEKSNQTPEKVQDGETLGEVLIVF
jgi:hypothetical protein